ncbi:uncharacterized protein LTR77_005852 [Saxophila tyrrhenica]|uniref:Uncharacterized protein n=1 Tax=Saxophila tyrrhenica TaxID=1690608 RepID=A0AAV9P9M2_9PEZI|nr:hypothetical protein LTR77_005852 [Saxophila tyrrhenica]
MSRCYTFYHYTPTMASKRAKAAAKQTAGSQYPSPFSKAPPSLEPLLPQLNPAQVYITHIDRHRAEYKKQIYVFAIVVNTTIAALLLWRLYAAIPKYFTLVETLLGYVTSETVDPTSTTRQQQLWILARRVAMFGCDYALVQFVVPWPLTFFAEQPANPVTWRWQVPFQRQEVVIRASRGWGSEELLRGKNVGDRSPYWQTRILPAIERDVMEKTGYLMMGANFDLDFGLMQDAHILVKEGKVKWDDLDRVVLVHSEGGGWLTYSFGTPGDAVEEQRKRMMAFRELLLKMGKESLFWKWQEIVEEERQKDGSVTAETQERIKVRVAEVFAQNGVDFDEAMAGVGEVGVLPAPAP